MVLRFGAKKLCIYERQCVVVYLLNLGSEPTVMIASIMQPYYVPYIGYWELIKKSDVFVLYDDAQFIKGGWINRNKIEVKGSAKYLTIPLKNQSPNKLINEIEIAIGFSKYMDQMIAKIQNYYFKAKYIDELFKFINLTHDFNGPSLISKFLDFNITKTLEILKIETPVLNSSDLPYDNNGTAEQKVKSICKIVGARTYINPVGGKHLYHEDHLNDEGLKLKFYESFLTHEFGYNSILDVIANFGIDNLQNALHEV